MNELGKQLLDAIQASPRLKAIMRVIREGETSQDDAAYRTIVGGDLFDSFADHPRKYVRIARLGVTSSAAGAYQFLARTWDECAAACGLTDFSHTSQDIACAFLIRRRGAMPDALAGRLEETLAKCAKEWASLPGSPYGQGGITLARAKAVYERYLGETAPTPIPPAASPRAAPPVTAPLSADETPTTFDTPPSPEKPMTPLISILAGTLLDIFTPLAKDKLTKEMGRHTGRPEVAEKVAEGVINAAKAVTGLSDPLDAVSAVRKEPELVRRVEALSMEQLGGVLALAERMALIDETSLKHARDYARSDDLLLDTKWVRLKFIHVLSLLFVSFAAWFVVFTWSTLTPEIRGAIITLMVIAGWNGVRDFWMGSSDGSQRKTAALMKKGDE